MKRFGISILAIGLLALFVADVDGSGCAVRFRSSYSYQARAAYVAPIAIATFVAVPLYTATYGAPVQAQPAQSTDLAAVLKELQSLRAQVRQLQGQPPQQQQPSGAAEKVPAPKVSLLEQSCARCHSGAGAKGKLRLFDGDKRLALTPEQMGDAIARVLNGTMPPPKDGQLAADDKVAVLKELMSK